MGKQTRQSSPSGSSVALFTYRLSFLSHREAHKVSQTRAAGLVRQGKAAVPTRPEPAPLLRSPAPGPCAGGRLPQFSSQCTGANARPATPRSPKPPSDWTPNLALTHARGTAATFPNSCTAKSQKKNSPTSRGREQERRGGSCGGTADLQEQSKVLHSSSREIRPW